MNAHTKQQQDKVFETDFIDSQKSDPLFAYLLALSHIIYTVCSYHYTTTVFMLIVMIVPLLCVQFILPPWSVNLSVWIIPTLSVWSNHCTTCKCLFILLFHHCLYVLISVPPLSVVCVLDYFTITVCMFRSYQHSLYDQIIAPPLSGSSDRSTTIVCIFWSLYHNYLYVQIIIPPLSVYIFRSLYHHVCMIIVSPLYVCSDHCTATICMHRSLYHHSVYKLYSDYCIITICMFRSLYHPFCLLRSLYCH